MFGTKDQTPVANLVLAVDKHVRIHGESLTADVLFRQEVVRLTESLASLLQKSSSLPTEQLDLVRRAVRSCQGKLLDVKRAEGIE